MSYKISFCLMLLSFSSFAFAAGMPWDSSIQIFISSITGPVAAGLALAAIVFGGMSLLLGGEWSLHRTRPDKAAHQSSTVLGHSFAKPMFILILSLGVLLGAAQIIALFGIGAGAVLIG